MVTGFPLEKCQRMLEKENFADFYHHLFVLHYTAKNQRQHCVFCTKYRSTCNTCKIKVKPIGKLLDELIPEDILQEKVRFERHDYNRSTKATVYLADHNDDCILTIREGLKLVSDRVSRYAHHQLMKLQYNTVELPGFYNCAAEDDHLNYLYLEADYGSYVSMERTK